MLKPNKFCLHWTAGTNYPCKTDIDSYHYIVDKDGKIYLGKYKPEDNIDCNDGKYARHCGGGNTGCIGISACGMFGFTVSQKQTKYPLTQVQIEAMCAITAHQSINYGITINNKTAFTHQEYDQHRPKDKREGKIDICYLPFLPSLATSKIPEYLRNKVNWYKLQFQKGNKKLVKKGNYYEIV